MAKGTLPGTANFCLGANMPIDEVANQLTANNIEVLTGPGKRSGAAGEIMSVYFNDSDGNLIETCNRL